MRKWIFREMIIHERIPKYINSSYHCFSLCCSVTTLLLLSYQDSIRHRYYVVVHPRFKKKIVTEVGYTHEQVFTIDETGPPSTALSLHLSTLAAEVGYSLKEINKIYYTKHYIIVVCTVPRIYDHVIQVFKTAFLCPHCNACYAD
jgi:hypothetical protein